MTAKKIPFCTDEELLDELKKLGYNDVSPDVLEIMKDDLSQLITKDSGQIFQSKRSVSGNEKDAVDSNGTKHRYLQKQFNRITRNISESENPLKPNVATQREMKYSDVSTSNGEVSKTSFEKYKNTLKSYKTGNYRRHDRLAVNNEEKSAEILYETSAEAGNYRRNDDLTGDDSEEKSAEILYEPNSGTTNYQRHDRLAVENREKKLSSEISYEPNPGTSNYRRHNRVVVDNGEYKSSVENLHEPISETDFNVELNGVANEQYQSKILGIRSEKKSYSDLKQSYAQRQIPRLQRTLSDTNKSPDSEASLENRFSNLLSSSDDISQVSAYDRYKNTLQNYKRNNYAKKYENLLPESNKNQDSLSESNRNTISETEYQSSMSSISLDPNKMKRKVLRHRDGKSVITEEFFDIPSIFNSSYPETQTLDSTKSFSSDDLSWKSNSSTGSISAVSPDASITPRSTYSLSSTRSLHSRLVNARKKKNDPVAMYNYYKKFWNEFKPPGEKTHDKIRWAVRDKMLDYNL